MLPILVRRQNDADLGRPVSLINELDRLFNRGWDNGAETALTGAYPVDIHEDDNHIYVDAEVPGFTKDELDVTLEDGILRINAERKEEEKPKGEAHLTERRYTRISRAFTLPTAVNESKVDARIADGVLNITLNKREEVKPRKVQIN